MILPLLTLLLPSCTWHHDVSETSQKGQGMGGTQALHQMNSPVNIWENYNRGIASYAFGTGAGLKARMQLTLQPACSHCRKSWPFAWILCVGNKNLDAAISYHLCQTPLNLPNLSIILNCRYPLSVFTLTFLSSVSNELSLLWKLLLTHEAKLQNCVSVKIVFAFLSLALGKKIDRIYRSPTLLSYLESYSADGLIIWYTCKHMRGICVFKMPSFHKLYSHKSGKSVIMGYLVEAALRVYILAIGGGISSY